MTQVDRKDYLQSILAEKNTYSLIFPNKQEQDQWFEKIQQFPAYKSLINEIKEEADRLLKSSHEEITYSVFKLYEETGSRLEYEKKYFARRRRLNTFAFMTLFEPQNKTYCKTLHDIIWSICNEYTWCLPAHIKGGPEIILQESYSINQEQQQYTIDLFSAETAFTLSEILELTKDFLDPLLQKRIIHEIYRRVIWPYMNQSYGWERATHNWAAVCAGSIGSVALHLFENTHELSIVLNKVLATMDYYLDGFNEDGTCLEGYGYWQYGFGYYVYFADLLKKRTNGQINLFAQDKVQQIALFQQKTFLYKNKVVNFSDAQPTASIFLGLSHYLAKVYDDVDVPENELRAPYTEDHTSRWAPAFRNLLWFDPKVVGKPWSDGTHYLEESQWIISRHTSMGSHFSFATKGGHNDEPHNHNDLGHFILQRNDEVFLKDLGSGLYNNEYFGKERYHFICNGSHGHSVPIVNGQFQLAGKEYDAFVQKADISEDVINFTLDLTNAYFIPTMTQFTREFTWDLTESPVLTLIDRYQFKQKPTSIIERFITPVLDIQQDTDGIILQGHKQLKIKYNQDQMKLKVLELDFLDHFGQQKDFLALDFQVKDLQTECDVKFEFIFTE